MRRIFLLKGLGICFLILFSLQFATAISSDLRDAYQPRETAIGKLSGVILQPINSQQVKLMRNNVQIAFEYDIEKIGNDYYLWFIAPSTTNNYSLIIEDVVTIVNGQTTIVDYRKDFSVSGSTIEYNVKPGFVISSQDFELISNSYLDAQQSISVDFPSAREVNLNPGQNNIEFSIDEVVGTQFTTINFGRYALPAYLIGGAQNASQNNSAPLNNTTSNQNNSNNSSQNGTQGNFTNASQQNQTNGTVNNFTESGEIKFKFNPEFIRSVVLRGTEKSVYSFKIENEGERTIRNLFFDYDERVFEISPRENFVIPPNESFEFNLTLRNSNGSEMRDVILAFVGEQSAFMIVAVNFTLDEEEAETEYFENSSGALTGYYCSELNGKFCAGGEICSGQNVISLDGNCCVGGICEAEKKTSYSWIGYLIAAIIILILLIVYLKYKKTKSPGNPMQKISSGKMVP